MDEHAMIEELEYYNQLAKERPLNPLEEQRVKYLQTELSYQDWDQYEM